MKHVLSGLKTLSSSMYQGIDSCFKAQDAAVPTFLFSKRVKDFVTSLLHLSPFGNYFELQHCGILCLL